MPARVGTARARATASSAAVGAPAARGVAGRRRTVRRSRGLLVAVARTRRTHVDVATRWSGASVPPGCRGQVKQCEPRAVARRRPPVVTAVSRSANRAGRRRPAATAAAWQPVDEGGVRPSSACPNPAGSTPQRSRARRPRRRGRRRRPAGSRRRPRRGPPAAAPSTVRREVRRVRRRRARRRAPPGGPRARPAAPRVRAGRVPDRVQALQRRRLGGTSRNHAGADTVTTRVASARRGGRVQRRGRAHRQRRRRPRGRGRGRVASASPARTSSTSRSPHVHAPARGAVAAQVEGEHAGTRGEAVGEAGVGGLATVGGEAVQQQHAPSARGRPGQVGAGEAGAVGRAQPRVAWGAGVAAERRRGSRGSGAAGPRRRGWPGRRGSRSASSSTARPGNVAEPRVRRAPGRRAFRLRRAPGTSVDGPPPTGTPVPRPGETRVHLLVLTDRPGGGQVAPPRPRVPRPHAAGRAARLRLAVRAGQLRRRARRRDPGPARGGGGVPGGVGARARQARRWW